MWRLIFILFCFCLMAIQVHSQCNGLCDYFKIEPFQMEPCVDTRYVLKFKDEFNGKHINKDVWMLIPWKQGSSINGSEKQINTLDPDNLEVSNGTLKISIQKGKKTRKQVDWEPKDKVMEDSAMNLRVYEYSSSNIWTKQNDFGEGKYEIRFRMDAMDAMWPAFWLYSGDGPTAGGSKWNEFDIFEVFYKKNKWDFTTNVHYDYENDGSNKDNFCPSHEKRKDLDEWHTVTCYFTEQEILIYLDDELMERKLKYRTWTGRPVTCKYPKRKARREMYGWPRESGHMVLNMALRNLHEGIPDGPDDFPCTFEVDYVKYWVLSDQQTK
ncbi:glycoside hydrolase family 16 protein [Parvicella tangerina]|uniref:GH16 domain-containing protein n=1 Tax=Parvicella tangerina TaxID=2829795 RepID=A0A916NDY3_9FLAO|nr:glycoside hydrolase family 16 protein [Parvicella tangerina]CAG5087847.1 hypothetical protein CRYO30217_03597 [Parvicella tangerina]